MGRKFGCNSAAKQRMAGKDYYAVVYGRVLRRGTEFMVVLVRVNCSQSNKFVAEARNRKKVEHSRGIERKIQAFSEAHCKFRAGYRGCSVCGAALLTMLASPQRRPEATKWDPAPHSGSPNAAARQVASGLRLHRATHRREPQRKFSQGASVLLDSLGEQALYS